MDIDSFQSEISEIAASQESVESPVRLPQESTESDSSAVIDEFVLTNDMKVIYAIVQRTINKIWESYSRTHEEFLTEKEIKKFLKDFLKSHDIDKSGLEIVYLNLDKKGRGFINKYEMTVFFLRLA